MHPARQPCGTERGPGEKPQPVQRETAEVDQGHLHMAPGADGLGDLLGRVDDCGVVLDQISHAACM